MMDAVPTKGSWYSYGDHRFVAGFSREAIYPRDAFHQQIHERDNHANQYLDINSYHNHGAYMPASISRSRMDSHERDADYGRSIYGSDFRSGNRNDSWKRREFCNSVCDTPRSIWERDQCPGSKRELSWSRGHEYRQRSMSPCVSSRNRSCREHNYDNEDNHRRSSVVPSATIKVIGLPKGATVQYLKQILAEWGPFLDARVLKERSSGSHRGIAFLDFPSIVSARTMMDAIGCYGLVVNNVVLRFEYSFKKMKTEYQQMHAKRIRKLRRQKAIERGTIDAPAQQQQQGEEKVLSEVEEDGEVRDNEVEETVEVLEEEAEDSGEEVGDSEADEVEYSEEEGEAEDSEVEEMLNEEGEVRDSEEEEDDGEETELQQFGVSTKRPCIRWTRKETNLVKNYVAFLSRQRKRSGKWAWLLRVGSHTFHPDRTKEQVREKARRLRGDTHRERTKRRLKGVILNRERTNRRRVHLA